MSEPYLAEVRIVGFNFAPRGYTQCDGALLPISQNQSLFSLLGTTYGGDGRTTFGLPDLRGRVPIHPGDNGQSSSNGVVYGAKSGEEDHFLQPNEVPDHNHTAKASSSDGDTLNPEDNILARRTAEVYKDPTNLADMHAGTITNAGGGQGHNNMQPFQALNFIIALQGLFPSRN